MLDFALRECAFDRVFGHLSQRAACYAAFSNSSDPPASPELSAGGSGSEEPPSSSSEESSYAPELELLELLEPELEPRELELELELESEPELELEPLGDPEYALADAVMPLGSPPSSRILIISASAVLSVNTYDTSST